MTIIGLLVDLTILIVAFVYLRRELMKSNRNGEIAANEPVGGAIPLIGWVIYVWWLTIGLWPERRVNVEQNKQPWRYRLMRFGLAWLLFVLTVMIIMILIETIEQIAV